MGLTLPKQVVELRPVLHQLLEEGGGSELGGAEPDVGRHRGKVFAENVSYGGRISLDRLSDLQGLQQLGVGNYQVFPVDEKN